MGRVVVELTRIELDKLSKYHIEVYALTGADAAELAIEDRYSGRTYAQIPFTWLIRALLRCQDEMTADEQDMLVAMSTFFMNPWTESRWRRGEDDGDLFMEVDTTAFIALLRRAHDACRPVEGRGDGGGVLDEETYVLELEKKTLDEAIIYASAVIESKRTMLVLAWGA
ncbi:MAG TPA: hypothetical protein VGM39_24120 [Kofleriaceae bacterium]|jgi:hypothetical protein